MLHACEISEGLPRKSVVIVVLEPQAQRLRHCTCGNALCMLRVGCARALGSMSTAGACAGAGPAHAKDIYRSMKLPVIGGLTQAEGEALGAFSTNSDLGVHGIMLENGVARLHMHVQHAQ